MSDIVERLRAWDAWDPPIGFDERKGHVAPQHVSGAEAADEIERLRTTLQQALVIIAEFGNFNGFRNMSNAELGKAVLGNG